MMTESITVTVQDGSRPPANNNTNNTNSTGGNMTQKNDQTRTNPFANVKFNLQYFMALPGIVKLLQLVRLLLLFFFFF